MPGSDENQTPADWKAIAAKWLFGQEAIVVLLFALFGSIVWAGYYLLTTGVPAHLAQIKSMATDLEKSHREERTEADKRHIDAIRELQTTFEKSEERHERWLRNDARGRVNGGADRGGDATGAIRPIPLGDGT